MDKQSSIDILKALEDDLSKDNPQIANNRHFKALKNKLAASCNDVQESEYKTLVNNVDDVSLTLLDPKNKVLIWNKGSEEVYHIDKEKAIGKSFLDFFQTKGDNKIKLEDILNPTVEANSITWFGYITRTDNTECFVSLVVNVIRHANGALKNFLVLTRNITSKRFSETKFLSIVETAPDGIILVNKKGVIELVNRKIETMFGYSREALLGKSMEVFIPDDIKKRHVGLRDGFLKNPKSRPMGKGQELRAQKSDGSQFFVEISLTPFETDKGMVVAATIRDITERKTYEKQIAASEERLNEAQLYAKMGSFQYDVNGNDLVVSAGWKRLLGLPEDYNVNQLLANQEALHEFFDESEFLAFRKKVKQGVEKNQLVKMKLKAFPRGEEKKRTWQVSVKPNYRDKGQLKILGVVQDITEQEKIQADLKSATQKAEEAVQLKQQFLANMSHEIRTPMNAILGFSRLMLRGNLNAEHEEFVGAIYDSAENLLVVLDDILDFSKMEVGKLKISPIHFNLQDLLRHLTRLFKVKCEENNIIFKLDFDDNIEDVLIGDPYRINQILINLMSNAVKFTERGTVTLSLKLKKETANEQNVCITLTDTGIGIPKDKQKTIFESFRQAEGHTTRKFGGTGLGLSIVKNLVDLMGGTIKVSSEFGKGSSFTLNIPFKVGDQNLVEKEEEVKAGLSIGTGHTILLAEDNKNNQLLASKLLSMHGFKVDIADNGLVALTKALKKRYSLILMDIQMPEMDGLEAYKHIKEKSMLNADVPIIALTAHALKEEERRFRAMGFNDYVHKPIKQKTLLTAIARQLSLETSVKEERKKELEKPSGLSEVASMAYLSEMLGDDKEVIVEMLEIFIEDVPNYVVNIKEALVKDDWETISKTAHTLKSTLGFTGREDLVVTAENLQHQKHKPTEKATLDLVENFCDEALKVVNYFQERLSKNDF